MLKFKALRINRIPSPTKLYKLFYKDRYEKALFISRVFKSYFDEGGDIIDVGGAPCCLRNFINNPYVCVDITDVPGVIRVDLEKEKLPFRDNSFDIVVCTDVLEHLDNPHEVFREVIRVAKKYIIISLPNMFQLGFRLKILMGRDDLKFYGLPSKPPGDRHKWFFSYNQARRFVHYMAKVHGAEILEEFPYFDRSRILRTEIFWPIKLLFPNLFAQTYWCVLKKISKS